MFKEWVCADCGLTVLYSTSNENIPQYVRCKGTKKHYPSSGPINPEECLDEIVPNTEEGPGDINTNITDFSTWTEMGFNEDGTVKEISTKHREVRGSGETAK